MKKLSIALAMLFAIGANSAHAGGVVSTAKCAALMINPIGIQVAAAIKIAKAADLIDDLDHCLEIVDDTKLITQTITESDVLGALVHGAFGYCACKAVF